jgi:hypothetical protein
LKLAGPGAAAAAGFWPTGWWSIVDFKIGIVPLLAKAACPGFGVSGQADEVRKRLRRILRRGGIMGASI